MGTLAMIHIKQFDNFAAALDAAENYAARFHTGYVVETVYPKFDTPRFMAVAEPHIGYAMAPYMVKDATGTSVTPIYEQVSKVVMVPNVTGRQKETLLDGCSVAWIA